jgi:hypothetical protein
MLVIISWLDHFLRIALMLVLCLLRPTTPRALFAQVPLKVSRLFALDKASLLLEIPAQSLISTL